MRNLTRLLCFLMVVGISIPTAALTDGKTAYIAKLTLEKGSAYAQDYQNQLLEYEMLEGPADVVFLGDSLTFRGDWDALSADLSIRNLGINGDTIAGLNTRLDAAVTLQPRALFLLIGINDLITTTQTHFCNSYAAFLDRLTAELPDTEIYVQSLLPVRDDLRKVPNNDVLAGINDSIRQMALDRGLVYIDLFTPLLDAEENELNNAYHVDGLHLNEIGYEVWKTVLSPIFRDLERSSVE